MELERICHVHAHISHVLSCVLGLVFWCSRVVMADVSVVSSDEEPSQKKQWTSDEDQVEELQNSPRIFLSDEDEELQNSPIMFLSDKDQVEEL